MSSQTNFLSNLLSKLLIISVKKKIDESDQTDVLKKKLPLNSILSKFLGLDIKYVSDFFPFFLGGGGFFLNFFFEGYFFFFFWGGV